MSNKSSRSKIKVSWKEKIKIRDGHKCVYCGSKDDLTIDHVIPLSRGGSKNQLNCVTACYFCNITKGDKTPAEAGLRFLEGTYPSKQNFLTKDIRMYFTDSGNNFVDKKRIEEKEVVSS